MASLGDKAEDIPATKKAEKIKANNNESTVVEEEGKEQHQCDNCDFKCEMFNTIKNHITVKHVRVCKYNKFGYCKIRKGCKRQKHVKTVHPVQTLKAARKDNLRSANYLN